MRDDSYESIRRLFEQVIDLPAVERVAHLDRECVPSLRPKLEAMLANADAHDNFLADPPQGAAPTLATPLAERPGAMIGRYKLLEQIGEGGFGVVFLVEQREPVHRRVALKIIKLGMDTKAVIARFEAERQALATMDHPNIARVLDAGATETGRPYFVMELVKGEPITRYCDAQSLVIPERLALFTQVCHAVQHAHSKGVIHRDLKPSNILVSTHDGRPLVKVIDFGIAKATDHRSTERTLFTEHRALIGTPEYMSPEQAEGSLDIDTRSDVYSLGVLLYELLTGATPFDPKQLRAAAFGEIQRIIREAEPQKPSTRVSTLATILQVATQRRAEPRKLGTLLRGDLDWIVMRSLEKDRSRRYETAVALAEDVRRHLASEPVLAGPPGARYRLRKFVGRHKVGVAAGSFVAVALVLGLTGTSAGMAWAMREQARAENRAATADRVKGFMLAVFESQHPELAQGEQLSVAELLARGAQRIETELRDEPLIQAELQESIAGVHQSRGEFAQAEALLEKSLKTRIHELGPRNETVALTQCHLGWALKELNRFTEAQAQFEAARSTFEAAHGPQHERVAMALNGLAEVLRDQDQKRAEALYRQALEIRRVRLGDDHPATAQSLVNLGIVLRRQGDNAGAEECYREALPLLLAEHGEESIAVGELYASLGVALSALDRLDEAEEALRNAQRILGRLWNGRHPVIAQNMVSLGQIQSRRGRFQDTETSFRAALEMQRELRGNVNTDVANALKLLGTLRIRMGDPASALPMKREACDILHRLLTPQDPRLGTACGELSWLLSTLGQHEESIERMGEYLCIRQAAQGGAIKPLDAHNLGWTLLAAGRAVEAEPLLRFARDTLTSEPDKLELIRSEIHLGRCLAALSRWDEAERQLLSANALATTDVMNVARGQPHVLRAFVAQENALDAREALAALYAALGKHDDADAWRTLASEARTMIQAIRDGAIEMP